jgi:uncharacterized protein (TIGR02594 family)
MPDGHNNTWPWQKSKWIQGQKCDNPDDDSGDQPGNNGIGDEKEPVKEPPQYTIESAEIVVPEGGVIEGKPFDFKGKIRLLSDQNITDSELCVEAILHYGNKTEANSQPISMYIDKSNNTFAGEFEALHQPEIYFHDSEKKPGAKYSVYLTISGCMADKDFSSPEVEVTPGGSTENDSKTEPEWISIARKEIGVAQATEGRTPDRIIEYHHATTMAEEWTIKHSTPWCSSFANWVLKQAGYDGPKDAHVEPWINWGDSLEKPAFGCIGIVSSEVHGPYHVGFVVGKRTYSPTQIGYLLLGGNQGKPIRHVCVVWFSAKELKTFRIPKGYKNLNYELNDIQGDFSVGSHETTR